MLHLSVAPYSFHKQTYMIYDHMLQCFKSMFHAIWTHKWMNDAHVYEMQVQLWKPNTWGVTVIIRRSLWMTQLKLWAVVGDLPRRSVKESTRREHLILARIKGELHPCAGAPTRTSGEWRLSDTLAKHHRIPSPLFTLSIYFEQFNTCLLHS